MEKTFDLTPQPLKRKMDPNAMGNDAAQLRALTAMMNNPALTGAVVPPEEAANIKPAPLMPVKPAATCSAPACVERPAGPGESPDAPRLKAPGVKPAAVAGLPRKLFFTGFPRVGKSWLGDQLSARVFEFDDPIFSLATDCFGPVRNPKDLERFVLEVRAWGDGSVSERYPLTAARAMFVEYIRAAGAARDKLFGIPVQDYGTAGFWNKCLIARVTRFEQDFPKHLVVVTEVTAPDQYAALREAGFRPYHVACNPLTRSSRGGAPLVGTIAESIERDITQKISQQPQGGKMWAVWNDQQYPPPSSRFLSVQEFFSLWA